MALQVGQIDEIYEEGEIELKIRNISYIPFMEENIFNGPSFSFAGNLWHFTLFLSHPFTDTYYRDTRYIDVLLCKENKNDYSVEYDVGVKKLDGSVEHLGKGNFGKGRSEWCCSDVMRVSELMQENCELAPSDVLTLVCTLKHGTNPRDTQPSMMNRQKPQKRINLDGLSQSFKDLFADKDSCDTTLRVKEKEYKAHRLVLIARSSVFSAMFHNSISERQTGIISIPDCDPDSFQEFLEYLYCGQLEDLSFSSAYHLYNTSDKYDAQDLKTFCVECLLQSLTPQNVCEVIAMADKYDDRKLYSGAQDFFNENMNKIFCTTEWDGLMRDNIHLAKKMLQEMSSKVKTI